MSSSSSVESKTKGDPKVAETNISEKPIHYKDALDYEGKFSEEELSIINEHLNDYSLEECLEIINAALKEHLNDPSLNRSYYDALEMLVSGREYDESQEEWEYRVRFETFLIHDWSIYPSVRTVTRPYEELDEGPIETIRVYLLSVVISCAGSALATFFNVRFPSISISSIALQLFIAEWGRLMSFIPDFSFPIGFGNRVHFGGGKWTFKEQMLATCGMTVGNNFPYAQYAIIAMANKYFYGFEDMQGNFGFTIMLTLASNLMGFGLAGLYRVFLVYPTQLIYWSNLPQIRLSRSLVEPELKEKINGWSLSSQAVFWITSVIFFCWYWVTDFIIPFFSYFDWMCWINPNDNNLIAITGVTGGVGFTPMPTLDPSITTMSALIQPFYSTFMNWFGMVLGGLVVIGMCYMNVSYTGYIPINTTSLYNRNGDPFNVREILNSDHKFDQDKFANYGYPFWSAGNLVSYGSFFAFYPSIIVYAFLEYGTLIWRGLKIFGQVLFKGHNSLNSFNDRFARAQRKYKEVPEWWFLFCLVACIGLAIATVEHYKYSNTPVWTIFFGIGLTAVFMIPCGILNGITNVLIEINVLFELVIGLICAGNGNALMISKVFATNFNTEADSYLSNLKTAHYCNIPPRAMFRCQVINMICNSFVQAGLTTWQSMPDSIPDMCNPKNVSTNKFTCNGIRVYFNAAVEWGTMGPKVILKDLYPGMRYVFLFGALYPIPFWFLRHFVLAYARRHGWGEIKQGAGRIRNSRALRSIISLEWLIYFNDQVMLGGSFLWGQYSLGFFTTLIYLGLVFAVYLPKHYPRWWAKYNYMIYAGTTVGYVIGGLIVFFATEYKTVPDYNWWGVQTAISLAAEARLKAPEGGFGPPTKLDAVKNN